MKKMIVAFAAVAAMTLTAGVAEAGGKGKNKVTQTGQFSSGGLVNLSPNVSVGGVLNGSAILSGNNIGNGVLSNIGVGVLGTGILSSSTSVKDSYNNGGKKRRH